MVRKPNHSLSLSIEELENRTLPTGGLILNNYTGILTIDGTSYADHAQARVVSDKIEVILTFDASRLTRYYDRDYVKGIYFYGFEGDDRFVNQAPIASWAFGGAGHDSLDGGDVFGKLYGGSGADDLIGGNGNDQLYGAMGNDALYAGAGDDRLHGGSGSDFLSAGSGDNIVDQEGAGPMTGWVFASHIENVLSRNLSVTEREVINYTNMEREERGLPLVRPNLKLVAASQYHAQNMADHQHMAHVFPDEQYADLSARLDSVGYIYYTAAENIAVNYIDARSLVAAWMSSGHRANILDPYFRDIGVGVRFSSGGTPYFCEVFGDPT